MAPEVSKSCSSGIFSATSAAAVAAPAAANSCVSCCGLGTSSSPYFAGEEEPPAAASMGTPMAPPLPGDIPGQPTASHKSLKNKKIRKTRR